MLTSSIAASVSLRKSFSLIGSSPRASRCAFNAMRRYLVTVTPGIATGYWNAMKRPARERSSGSASVISRPGWPMITFARVDLPEPFGPISAWISPFETSRSRPLRISLSSARTCRLRISRSANCCRLLRGRNLGGRELDELVQRCARQRPRDAAVNAGPEHLGRAEAVVVGLVRAEHAALPVGVEALHRGHGSLERLD